MSNPVSVERPSRFGPRQVGQSPGAAVAVSTETKVRAVNRVGFMGAERRFCWQTDGAARVCFTPTGGSAAGPELVPACGDSRTASGLRCAGWEGILPALMKPLFCSVLVALGMLSQAAAAPVSLFDGKSLAGWEGETNQVWRVRDGVIVGGSLEGNPRNEFLATLKSYKNFHLRLEYKLVGTQGFVNGGEIGRAHV